MTMTDMFTVTETHVDLLRRMTFDWDGSCEFGAVSSDPKRPFGNSDVDLDITEIVGKPLDSPGRGDGSEQADRLLVADLAAVVNALVQSGVLDLMVGHKVLRPYRVARLRERSGRSGSAF